MTIAAHLNKLDERERKLLSLLGIVAVVLLVVVVPIALLTSLASARSENESIRTVLNEIEDARSTINERKARKDAVLAKYANPAPGLGGFIEQAAKAHSLTAADTQDKPETPHGKLYSERFTVVKMHKIGMKPFVEMLQQIETSGHPLAITRLNIKPRPNEPDQYEIEVGISAYDRKGDAKGTGKGAASASPTSSAGAGSEDGK
ncbi:MAG: type II secretion system protein M [Polyangiaceae bacterium]|nr:type II secretion system protein M [Polyangiaceae bacterium]